VGERAYKHPTIGGRRSSRLNSAAAAPRPRYARKMKNKDKDDYKVIFGGAAIPKKEAIKVGVAMIFGLIGIIAIGLTFDITTKLAIGIISLILAFIGYFGIANRLFKG